jgi:DNA (cytosine-5)-methyltransferase 1
MNICLCREVIPEQKGSGRKQTYCSEKCKQKAYRKRVKRNAPSTAYSLRNPYKKPVLSLFPGIVLDQAFEEHGFCVVREPDLLWGGDIHHFHPPSGSFGGIIAGPPCQAFSRLRYLVEYNGHTVAPNLIPQFERCIQEAQPDWFLMENVPAALIPHVAGYTVQSLLLNNRSFSAEQYRPRRICFGGLNGLQLHIEKDRTEKKQKA